MDNLGKNTLILGNNLTGLQSDIVNIILGEKCMNFTVVGTGNEKVVDNGINNKVTCMKKVPGGLYLGPPIRAYFRIWRGIGYR